MKTPSDQQFLHDPHLLIAAVARGKGIGKALLAHLAQRCVREGRGRFEWWVLNWNEPSIEFYKSQGGVMQDEWTKVRVEGDALHKLGGGELPAIDKFSRLGECRSADRSLVLGTGRRHAP